MNIFSQFNGGKYTNTFFMILSFIIHFLIDDSTR